MLGQEVVSDAPDEAGFGALKDADGAEPLVAVACAHEQAEESRRVAVIIDAGAELKPEPPVGDERSGGLHGGPEAEVGADAEIFGALGAIDAAEDGEVFQPRCDGGRSSC